MQPIAHIHTEFPTKFGIPRQSGLVPQLEARIIFTPEYRNPDALRGLEGFSYLLLIWEVSAARREGWSPKVRPPRLGGNKRLGVFATRSPFRPNPLGLSCVKLEKVELEGAEGPILHIRGADLLDGTPVFDVKPYLPYADCRPEASGGFAPDTPENRLTVELPPELAEKVPAEKLPALFGVLAGDPRPSYQNDPQRVYGMAFAGLEVKFRVENATLFVLDVQK